MGSYTRKGEQKNQGNHLKGGGGMVGGKVRGREKGGVSGRSYEALELGFGGVNRTNDAHIIAQGKQG